MQKGMIFSVFGLMFFLSLMSFSSAIVVQYENFNDNVLNNSAFGFFRGQCDGGQNWSEFSGQDFANCTASSSNWEVTVQFNSSLYNFSNTEMNVTASWVVGADVNRRFVFGYGQTLAPNSNPATDLNSGCINNANLNFSGEYYLNKSDVTNMTFQWKFNNTNILLYDNSNNLISFFNKTANRTPTLCVSGGAGNTISLAVNYAVVNYTDTTKPKIAFAFPNITSSYNTTTGDIIGTPYTFNVSNINYTFSDDNPAFCWFNRGGANSTPVTCGTNFSFVTSIQGLNTWRLFANDTSGNQNTTNITFIRDIVVPIINYVAGGTVVNGTFKNVSNIGVSASGTDTTYVNVTIRLYNKTTEIFSINNASRNPSLVNSFLTWNFTNLTDGVYFFNVSSCDFGNLCNTTATRNVTIDTTAPLITILYPQNISYNSNVSSINYSVSDTTAGFCWYSRDGGLTNSSFVQCGTNFTNVLSVEGSNTWTVYANDTVGFRNSSSVSFHQDTITPLIQFGAGTESNNSILARSNIIVNVTASDTNLANVTIRLYNSSGQVSSFNSASSPLVVNFSNLSNGIYYFNATTYDSVLNYNFTETRQVTIDTTNPNGTLIAPPHNLYTNQTAVNFTINATDNLNLANITLYIYNGTVLINQTTQSTSGNGIFGIVYNFLFDDIYTWFYQLFDTAGNSAVTSNRTLTIDTTYPQLSIGYPDEAGVYSYVVQNITHSVNETNLANCTFTNGGLPVFITCNTLYSVNSSEGNNTWNITATDLVNQKYTRKVNFFVDSIFPQVNYSSGTPSNNNATDEDTFSVNVTINETNFASIRYILANQSTVVYDTSFFTPISSIIFSNLTNGVYTYNVSVFDTVGHKTSTATRNITVSIPVIEVVITGRPIFDTLNEAGAGISRFVQVATFPITMFMLIMGIIGAVVVVFMAFPKLIQKFKFK